MEDDPVEALVRTRDRDRWLAAHYAPAGKRSALFAVQALDLELLNVVATTTEPMLGRIRLAWWRESVEALAGGVAPAHPVLRGLVGVGVEQARVEALADGFERLLDAPGDEEALIEAAAARGAALFGMLGAVLGGAAPDGAGAGWALLDLCRVEPARATPAVLARAREWLDEAGRAAAAVRPATAVARAARRDLGGRFEARGTPRRQLALLAHVVTGRI